MAGCQIPVIDHVTTGLSWLATQYTESTNLKGYLTAFLTQCNELETAFQELLCDRTIDDAYDATLDYIGALVGQSRYVYAANTNIYFGFQGSFNTEGFVDTAVAGSGGAFRGAGDSEYSTVELTDEEYRTFIRGRIFRNHSDNTMEDVIEAIRYFIPLPVTITITESYPAQVDFVFSTGVDETLLAILFLNDLIPRPVGVSYTVNVA